MLADMTTLLLAREQANGYEGLRERSGIYHLAGSGYTSRYEWAKQILAGDPRRSEQSVQSVEPGRSTDFPTPAVRPLFSALDCSRFEDTFGLRLPPWRSTLELAMAG
jgi:dTDP-4-dehydrorhamnose reductase